MNEWMNEIKKTVLKWNQRMLLCQFCACGFVILRYCYHYYYKMSDGNSAGGERHPRLSSSEVTKNSFYFITFHCKSKKILWWSSSNLTVWYLLLWMLSRMNEDTKEQRFFVVKKNCISCSITIMYYRYIVLIIMETLHQCNNMLSVIIIFCIAVCCTSCQKNVKYLMLFTKRTRWKKLYQNQTDERKIPMM